MAKMISPSVEWHGLLAQAKALVPEAFSSDGRVLNLMEGEWGHPGHGKTYMSPVDGTLMGNLPMLNLDEAKRAVRYCAQEFKTWSKVSLDQRKQRVVDTLALLKQHRELIGRLLIWEIGKPYITAMTDVDRCISGVEWYVDQIDAQMAGRTPLGVISNIASWNYPLSVLVHAMLVQVLAGNSVIAKTPTDGGLYALTVSLALARRCGLPVSLVSGSGGQLSEALVRNADVDCLAFVGGKSNGRDIAASLYDRDKRYMLEMEGINVYGIWEFSDWNGLAQQLKKGYDYGKQRCTAYVRFAVQRKLFPKFLDTYIPVLKGLKYGNPTLVDNPNDPLPNLDFGPLINAKKVEELRIMQSEAISLGAIGLYESDIDESLYLPNQDTSAYFGPSSILNVPRNARLHHNEPFGPLDTIVLVDRIEELVSEMNISNGSLVSSLACDDDRVAKEIAGDLRSYKVGLDRKSVV